MPAGIPGRGSDMPLACHSLPRPRFAALYTREPSGGQGRPPLQGAVQTGTTGGQGRPPLRGAVQSGKTGGQSRPPLQGAGKVV